MEPIHSGTNLRDQFAVKIVNEYNALGHADWPHFRYIDVTGYVDSQNTLKYCLEKQDLKISGTEYCLRPTTWLSSLSSMIVSPLKLC